MGAEPGGVSSVEAPRANILMFDWFRKKEAPLTGAPAVRRQKTHSAESGYVYQYFYEGQRAAKRDGAPGTQYVFNVSADRKSSSPVSVFVGDDALANWQAQHARDSARRGGFALAQQHTSDAVRSGDAAQGVSAYKVRRRLGSDLRVGGGSAGGGCRGLYKRP